jgi:predicted DNA-binding protein
MKTQSFKYKEETDRKLKAVASASGIAKSTLIRKIVENFIENDFEGYDDYKYVKGNKILIKYGKQNQIIEEVYADTKEPFKKPRPCIRCGESTSEGYDACLGYIEGAEKACCGHGVREGYILLKTGRKIRLIDDDSLEI